MNRDIADMRENYTRDRLLEKNAPKDAMELFRKWFEEANTSKISEPNAMIIATVNASGVPSARTVLLKELDPKGFIFYTNYESHKANDIAANPNVSLVFLWKEIERQVRITGKAKKISKDRSLKYFHKRPKGSQIGAWTSPQSKIIEDREVLEKKQQEIEERFRDVDKLPLPEFWGGYIVEPQAIEFWQGRTSRLHDRLQYSKQTENWKIERLAP